ncbi:MAG: sigma-70 family RNA polymerase sigma factor [PVC group bacterium]
MEKPYVTEPDDRLSKAAWIRAMLQDYEQALIRYTFGITGDLESARDVVQDAFLKLCRADRTKVRDRMPAWLYRVCRNRAFDVRKKEGRMQPLHEEQLSRLPSQRPGPAAQAEREESRRLVLAVLNELPVDQREACHLKFNDELTYREIGRVMGKSIGTVSSLLTGALNTIRKRLGAGLEPAPEV